MTRERVDFTERHLWHQALCPNVFLDSFVPACIEKWQREEMGSWFCFFPLSPAFEFIVRGSEGALERSPRRL